MSSNTTTKGNGTMKRTNTKHIMQCVEDYLCNAISNDDGAPNTTETRELFAYAYGRFLAEYGHEIGRRGTEGALSYWLSGLAIGIDYSYCDIIARAEEWHECKLTEKQEDMVCASWFDFLACKFLQISQRYGIAH